MNSAGKILLKRNISSPKCNIRLENNVTLISARWRLPRWSKSRPSKLFYVPTKPEFNPEENADLRTKNVHFNTTNRCTMHFLRKNPDIYVKEMLCNGLSPLRFPDQEETVERYVEKRFRLLQGFNQQSKEARESYLQHIADEKRIEYEVDRVEIEGAEQRERDQLMATVQHLQDNASNFYTEENMEEQIELMLQKSNDFNFCIDSSGDRFYGKSDVYPEELDEW